jgi:hypothetical protein
VHPTGGAAAPEGYDLVGQVVVVVVVVVGKKLKSSHASLI